MALAEISDVERCVRERFKVKEVLLTSAVSAEFSLSEGGQFQQRFEDLVRVLRPMGFIPILRQSVSGPTIYVASTKGLPKRQLYLPVILFAVTMATVAVDGWLKSSALAASISDSGVIRDTLLYVAFMAAFLIVPFSVRYLFSIRSGAPPPIPYFIPGLPPSIPTFGALYSMSEPPVNRDDEMVPAVWATLSGLAVASVTLLAGLLDTRLITQEAAAATFGSSAHFVAQQLPLGLDYLVTAFLHPTSQGTILSPLVFAGWFGFLISFANMIPTRQLEGWRIAGGFLGRRSLAVAALISIFVMVFVSFWMALFVFAVSWGTRDLLPLDDISKASRRDLYLLALVLVLAALAYLLMLYPQLPTFPSIY